MLSVRGLWFRPGNTVEACAEDWVRRLARTQAIGHRLAHFLEVRYESLVTAPEETLRTICGFLDLTFEPVLLRYAFGQVGGFATSSCGRSTIRPTRGLGF